MFSLLVILLTLDKIVDAAAELLPLEGSSIGIFGFPDKMAKQHTYYNPSSYIITQE